MKTIILLIFTLLLNPATPAEPQTFSPDHCALAVLETPNERRLTVTFVGDVMCHSPQYKSVRRANGSYDFRPWFEYLKSQFRAADLMVGNLETTLSESHYSGYPSFRTPIALADALKDAGFDVLGTANNHSLDGALRGLELTLSELGKRGIATTGTYPADQSAAPLMIQKNGIKLGFIASTYGTNGIPLPKAAPHVVNLNDLALYDSQIKVLREQAVDGIVACIHWGNEYQRKPSANQIKFARELAARGVDVIIGSHPHVVQPDGWLEGQNGKKCYVVYSLGNAISNQRRRYTDSGLALNITFKKRAAQNLEIENLEYTPFWVDKYNAAGQISYAMIPLYDAPKLKRLSKDDQIKMKQALDDFEALFQIKK